MNGFKKYREKAKDEMLRKDQIITNIEGGEWHDDLILVTME